LTKTINVEEGLKRLDLKIFRRIISRLYENNEMKRSAVALKAGIGYRSCVLYLDWLDEIDLIKTKTDDDGYIIISLNERGRKFYKRKYYAS